MLCLLFIILSSMKRLLIRLLRIDKPIWLLKKTSVVKSKLNSKSLKKHFKGNRKEKILSSLSKSSKLIRMP